MYEKFVKHGVKHQINVYDEIRTRVQEKVRDKDITITLFDKAERVALDLMKGNQYHPFMQTKEAIEWKKNKEKRERKKGSSACNLL